MGGIPGLAMTVDTLCSRLHPLTVRDWRQCVAPTETHAPHKAKRRRRSRFLTAPSTHRE
jgi:hypothetical protein